jgi:hypothetical protein
MIELADKNVDEWILEGQALMNEMCASSFTFAMGFAIGQWWERRPK